MKVILGSYAIYPFHGVGGQEKHPYYFAQALLQQGVEVEVVCSDDGKGKRREVYEGIPFTFLPPRCIRRRVPSPWILLFSWNMSRYLKGQHFHILHSFTDTAYFYLHHRQRVPVVMQPFNMEPFQAPSFMRRRGLPRLYQENFIRRPWRYCFAHADGVAAETPEHIDELVRVGAPQERIFLLPQGVDLAQIEQKGKQSPITREKLGLAPADPVVLSIFRYWPDTGLNYLVEAFPHIVESLPQAKLIIAGRALDRIEVETYQSILSRVSALGLGDKVKCLSNVTEAELYGYYGIADVFVSPNIREGRLFKSTQEAMAFGLPIVSTDQEPLVKEGENGYIIPKKDPAAIAQGVLRILQGGRAQEMGLKSRQIVSEYDLAAITARAIAEYRKLVGHE